MSTTDKATAPEEASQPTPPPKKTSTVVDNQRRQLEKLMKNPEKAAYIPSPSKPPSMPKVNEFQHNVQGSVAGAGSGEFHVYRAQRRRELARIKILEDEAKSKADTAEFDVKIQAMRQEDEDRTAKKRAKRQKRKQATKKARNDPS